MSLDQSNKTDDGIRHNIAGHQVLLPEVAEVDLASEPVCRFSVAMEFVNGLHQHTAEVMGDNLLSNLGKEQKLKDYRLRVLDTVAKQLEGMEQFSESINRREAELLKVPELHPQNAADASIDRELRDYWRSLSVAEQTKIMNEMKEGPKHQRLEIALLRSPYAQLDHQVKSVKESWEDGRRLDNPTEAFAIMSLKDNLEWGRRAMAHISPLALKTIALGKDEAIKTLVKAGRDKAAKAFGFSQDQIELARRQISLEEQRSR